MESLLKESKKLDALTKISFKSLFLKQSYIILMISNNQPINRQQKIAAARNSLRCLPLVNKLTLKIQDKYEQLTRKLNKSSLQPSIVEETSECESHSYQHESSILNEGYNSFLQDYEMLQKLGQGGNGCVYKCLYKPNNKFYAAKKFLIEQEHIDYLKKSFINMKQLDHPSICRYRALYFDQNQTFALLVMQYLPFPSLGEYRIRDEEELKRIVKQIIVGISYIHNRNLCHRDIKPENILYDEKNKAIKIIDFGISKRTYQRGVRRDMLTIIGTHLYLAPQVYNGGGYDQRIDLWALGVTVFKLITGYTPFQSQYHSQTITNICKGTLSFVDQVWKKYSPSSKIFVNQLLKERQERLSLGQAQKHYWLNEQSTRKSRLNRMVTHNISLNELFHHQIHTNVLNANSKEEGTIQDQKKLHRSINLINVKYYQLEDSEEDQKLVVTSKHPGLKRTNTKLKQSFSDLNSFKKQRVFSYKK